MTLNVDLGPAAASVAELERRVRALAAELLASGKVALVLGHRAPWVGWEAVPWIARTPAQALDLAVGPTCGAGLAKYLLDELGGLTAERPAVVVARGCDLLGVRRLVADHRVNGDLVKVIAIPCIGRFERRKVARAPSLRPALGTDLLADVCSSCSVRWPADLSADDGQVVGVDLLALRPPLATARGAGGRTPGSAFPAEHEIAAVSAMAPEQRLAYWGGWFDQCIRCYACRSVCPACHCEVCVLDSAQPSWLPRSTGLPAQFMFQFIRGMDVAGRCVGCGQCESACPAGIPLAQLWAKTAQDIADLFGVADPFLPGSAEPLGQFEPHDPDPTRVKPR